MGFEFFKILFIVCVICIVFRTIVLIFDETEQSTSLSETEWEKTVPYTRLVQETIYYTNDILFDLGIKRFPSFTIRYTAHKKYAGIFNGEVIVYLHNNPDIPTLVDTVLHEIMHFIQSKTDVQYKRYDDYSEKYGYWDNPFEIESRKFAKNHTEACLQYLEEKQLIRRITG